MSENENYQEAIGLEQIDAEPSPQPIPLEPVTKTTELETQDASVVVSSNDDGSVEVESTTATDAAVSTQDSTEVSVEDSQATQPVVPINTDSTSSNPINPEAPVENFIPSYSIEESEVDVINYDAPNLHVTQEYNLYNKLPKNFSSASILPVPPAKRDEMEAKMDLIQNKDVEVGLEARAWFEMLVGSFGILQYTDVFDKLDQRKDSQWVQRVNSQRGPLMAGEPRLNDNLGSNVTAARALQRIRSLTGIGAPITIPLFHTGIWATLEAPTESELIELYRVINEDKISIGRQTYGMAFSNDTVYITSHLIDFFIQHVTDTSVKVDSITQLRKLIRVTDTTTIVWGLALAIWRNGFQFSRPCIADPRKCNHVEHEHMQIAKALWVDQHSLTEWQVKHMANRGGSTTTLADVERYQSEFTQIQKRSFTVIEKGDNKIVFNLRIPTIEDNISEGQRWINGIVRMVDSTFTNNSNEKTRNEYLDHHTKATQLRNFVHWVESIDDGIAIRTDREFIESTLDHLSSIDEYRNLIMDEIKKYIADSTIAFIAITKKLCPNCQKNMEETLPRNPSLIPIDPITTFFTLLVPKLSQIQAR